MCDKAVATYTSAMNVVPECFMIQEMYDKAVNRCYFVFYTIPDRYKTQELCGRVVFEDLFLIVYCPDKYIIQKICDEAVDDPLAALKLIPYWFVTSEIIKKLFTALCADENILLYLMKILEMLYLIVMKQVFLIQILITLTLRRKNIKKRIKRKEHKNIYVKYLKNM